MRIRTDPTVEGATVSLDGNAVGVTGADGTLVIPDVTAGLHVIEAGKIGYESDLKYITVPETTEVTLTLTRLVYTVTVTVTGSGPIAGAAVYFDGSYVGLTNSAGGITITNVTAGSHTIRVSKSGYYDASKTISVPETTSVTLTLSPIPPAKKNTEVRLSSDKTAYTVGETAHLTQGLYDDEGRLISGRTVDYTVTLNGAWYAGWGQYSDDPSRSLLLYQAGTYSIKGIFAGDGTYNPSSKTITITARKIGTSIKLSSNKTSYTVEETAHLTQGLYDDAGILISGRTVDYTVTLDGVWYAGWGQYSDDPYRNLILSKSGTYAITGRFAGDETYGSSSKTITVTATAPEKIGTSIRISPNKTSYSVGETAYLTLGLYDEYGGIIDHSKIVDYTVLCNGSWYAGWGQYGDDPSRTLLLNRAGTYSITGSFAGDDTYEPSSKTVTITAG